MIVHPIVLSVLVVLGPLALATIAIVRGVRQRRSERTFDPDAAPESKTDSRWLYDHESRVATFPKAVREAHPHSSNHREEILGSRECGCFHCGQVFAPSQITEWTDSTDEDTEGTTAMCPFCGIDSVIGDRSGFAVTDAFLLELNKYWFQRRDAEGSAHVETTEEYWISGCKKDGTDALYSTTVEIDEDVRREYWSAIRNRPDFAATASFKATGKHRT